jgi:hypothetical protein
METKSDKDASLGIMALKNGDYFNPIRLVVQ